ncbi:MAG: gliding motility-associated C-terminal domain-containing protein, partial [Flavobacteriales bacterium]|nr:gliding motility-associated C-terminal domain-containing protein [Flavobacteriales bacterium]
AYTTSSGGTTPYTYAWSNSDTTDDITALVAGTYILTVSDATSCADTVSVTISEPAALVVTPTLDSNVTCNGDLNGAVHVSITGGTSTFNYMWSSGSSTLATTATSDSISGLSGGTYIITVTDLNGCSDTDSVSVAEPLALVLVPGSADGTCGLSNGWASVSVSGGTLGYAYLWDDPGAQTTDTASGLGAGTFKVVVTDAGGCMDSVSIALINPGSPTTAIDSAKNVSCTGANDGEIYTSTVGGASPYTYLWSNSDITKDITGLGGGIYILTVTDTNACTDTVTMLITEPLPLLWTVTVDNNVSCNGSADGAATVGITGGTSPFDYIWTPGSTTLDTTDTSNTLSGLSGGTYYVSVVDANNCSVNDSAVISEPLALVLLTASTDASCGIADGSAVVGVTGGTSPYLYVWNDPSSQTTATAVALFAGAYTVNVTDSNNCTDSAIALVNNLGAATVAVDSVVNVTCNGAMNGEIYITVTGGASPYTYFWTNLDTAQDPTGLAGGIYTVTVTDFGGCLAVATASLTEPTPISLTVSILSSVACNAGTTGSVSVTASGGNPPYTYLWDDPASQTDSTAVGLAAGSYTAMVSDSTGCSTSNPIVLSEPTALSVTLSSAATNCGLNDGSATAITSGGTSPYSYLWDDPAAQTNSTATNLNSGLVNVVVIDSAGCTTADSITLTEIPLTATAGTDVEICEGESAPLTASGGTVYDWTPGTGLDDSTAQNPIASPTSTTIYTVNVSSGTCPPVIMTVTITVNPNPMAYAGEDTTINLGSSVQLFGSGGTSYIWTPATGLSCTNCSTPLAEPEKLTTYIMTLTDANGCPGSDTITIDVNNDYTILVPDIFSPNADELINRVLFVQGGGVGIIEKFAIYDRWGEKVFENTNFEVNDPSTGWDGVHNGKLMNASVFVYYIEAVFSNGEIFTGKGDITLVH